jgi:L-galactose dehydrogenase
MKYRTLGRTGLEVSEISIGGASIMGHDPDKFQENTCEVLNRAFELGINYIDTAPLYGDSEDLLGVALEGEKRPYYLATKVGFKPENFDYRRDTVLRSLESSLKKLRRDKLTTAQIHEVNLAGWDRIMEPGGTLEGLREAQKRGMCEFIGITARAIPELARLAATGEFDTVMVYHDYHPLCQLAAEEVIPAAAAQNMGILPATILGGGLLFPEDERRQAKVDAIEDEAERERTIRILERLQQEPSTLPQQAFRWVLADERVSSANSGASSVAKLEDVVQASEMGPLAHDSVTPD